MIGVSFNYPILYVSLNSVGVRKISPIEILHLINHRIHFLLLLRVYLADGNGMKWKSDSSLHYDHKSIK